MADVFSKRKRSEIMSRVKDRNNDATELRLVRIFRAYNITGWRRHAPILGKPDFVFRKTRLAVFVDGCFWHGCRRCRSIPATNREFWIAKIQGNRERDQKVVRMLSAIGWKVIRIWEHELKADSDGVLRKLQKKRK